MDEEEMDAGKPTFSGPNCTGCSANRGESGYVPEATKHEKERKREGEHARYTDSMHVSYVQETKKETHPTPTETRICTTLYILMYKSKIQLRLRARLREVRLQQ